LEGKDNIKELFSQKLGNYEAPVNPELWAKISSQVAAGTTATATSTGLSVLAKVGIGLGISAAAITSIVLLTSSPDETTSSTPIEKNQKEIPTSSTTDDKEQVAELSSENEVNANPISEQNGNDNNSQPASSTPKTNEPKVDETPKEVNTTNSTFVPLEMPTNDVKTVIQGTETSEPTIVEGISFGDMTNYGAAPTNDLDPEKLEETTIPKVEPIKRYVNTFTPNGDGVNDYFELESEGLTEFSVVVLNPAGDVVFKSEETNFRWDGRDMRSGEIVDSGTYMYMVSAKDAAGNPFPIYERLTIIH